LLAQKVINVSAPFPFVRIFGVDAYYRTSSIDFSLARSFTALAKPQIRKLDRATDAFFIDGLSERLNSRPLTLSKPFNQFRHVTLP
jgi:hypothetical protein